ncbi:MAG: respiratory nitrate reductase subunit gamma, partial [Deltaproteobacteria bacterium]|nr:respiratory nitrate reductase subunit gamma [Deltaproteobacteria bacterium]
VGGMAYRFYIWKKLKQPGMTLFPTPDGGTAMGVLKETFLFPSLFRGDKVLWAMSWIFHVMLAFIFVGHIRVFMDFPWLWKALSINPETMSAIAGGAAGVAIMIMATLLLLRRMGTQRVREISAFSDYFALFLILGIILTGNYMRFLEVTPAGEPGMLEQTRAYFGALVTFKAAEAASLSPMFLLHFLIGQLLFLYIPFSKILHFGGIFFTQAALKRS